jgi:hypothetical protein
LVQQASEPGFVLYESCAGDWLWERHGERLPTGEELSALLDAHTNEWLAIDGVTGVGRGLCCSTSPSAQQCIHVLLQTHTTPVEALASPLAAALPSDSELCVGFLVELLGTEQPRCTPADPQCVPLAMCPEVTDEACCPVAPVFDPAGPREPATDTIPELAFLSEGSCAHDGECVLNGCGQYCTAYTVPGFISTCECYPGLAAAFCGCVDQACQWFFQ